MSTPGGYDPQHSNPYGGNPYGGGTPPPPPGGYHSYGAVPPHGGAPLDGVSVGALVTALLCCTGPVGAVLGVIGIFRTKGGRRRGRWMSVVGIVVGSLATIAMIATFVGLFWVGVNVLPESQARVGQCVDTSRLGDSNNLWKADCDEAHDAEIIAVGRLDQALLADLEGSSPRAFCRGLAAPEYSDVVRGDQYRIDWSTDAIGDTADVGDAFACYVERADGKSLTEPLTITGNA